MDEYESLNDILKKLDLLVFLPRFVSQRITADLIASLADEQLISLGITTIGDRLRLREEAKLRSEATTRASASHSPSSSAREIRDRLFSPNRRSLSLRTGSRRKKRSPHDEDVGRSWTVPFVCLASNTSKTVPNAEAREELYKCGLGLKKIQLSTTDSETDVFEKISTSFPPLKNCGGFELLRCQLNSRSLSVINCEWSVKNLQGCLAPQAKIYIRPIQTEINTSVDVQPEPTTSCIKVACNHCNDSFTLHELRTHAASCQSENHASTSASSWLSNTESTDDLEATEKTDDDVSESDLPDLMDISEVSNSITNMPDLDNLDDANDAVQPEFSKVLAEAIERCQEIFDPVEMLRHLQEVVVVGRKLEIEDPAQLLEGDTNFILVDRENIIQTAFDELKSTSLDNLRKTLEVQFYNETALDVGGPRKEFFLLILRAINEKFFDNGLRDLLSDDYITIGKILALSILQNGPLPTFLSEEIVKDIFSSQQAANICIERLREGLDCLGLYKVFQQLPILRHLLRSTSKKLTHRALTQLLQPEFSEDGSNARKYENIAYSSFVRYARSAASGRRGDVTLEHILRFATGCDEEPVLGFTLHPSISFIEVEENDSFLPTANTCINSLKIRRPSNTISLPSEESLFNMFDLAFLNNFYGLR